MRHTGAPAGGRPGPGGPHASRRRLHRRPRDDRRAQERPRPGLVGVRRQAVRPVRPPARQLCAAAHRRRGQPRRGRGRRRESARLLRRRLARGHRLQDTDRANAERLAHGAPARGACARCAEALAAAGAAGGGGSGAPPPIPPGPYVKKIKKHDDTERQQLSALASLPGIGEKLAVRLLGRFGTPLAVFNAPLADLAKVDGLGAARAGRIRGMLESTSRHHSADGSQRTLHDG